MSKRVKISVIVPVYNVQAYLPYALQSLMDQTLEDVEFVCVNDGSTDDSLAILEEFAKKFKDMCGWKNVKLTTLSEYYNIIQTDAHRAWCDAEANAYVYLELKKI